MKAEKEAVQEISAEPAADEAVEWPEPQNEFGRKLLALAKELDASGIPKLSLEEIEEYLGRKLGGIAEAYPDGVIPRSSHCTHSIKIVTLR